MKCYQVLDEAALSHHVLLEKSSSRTRSIWLPGDPNTGPKLWERISPISDEPVDMHSLLVMSAAIHVVCERVAPNWLCALLARWRRNNDEREFDIPNGSTGIQVGRRRRDAILVVASDDRELDQERVQQLYPTADRYEPLGKGIWLVAGVELSADVKADRTDTTVSAGDAISGVKADTGGPPITGSVAPIGSSASELLSPHASDRSRQPATLQRGPYTSTEQSQHEPKRTTKAIHQVASEPWQVRPVFVSSTFRDMQAERDYLRFVVFPRLEEELRKGRIHLEPIDLRQGVETADAASEETREQLVLKVCLDEIERSRPFLIVLLGDRYGWVPPQERMAAAAEEAGFTGDLHDKSVTALEIEFGILRKDPQQQRRSFFYFRESLPYEQMPEHLQADYSDEHSNDADIRRRYARLTELKQMLVDDPKLAPRVHCYDANWDTVQQKVVGLEAWGEQVYQHLLRELEPELRAAAARPPQTWEEQERTELGEFIEHRRRDFVGRKELLDQLVSIAVSPASAGAGCAISAGVSWGACILGEPGSGKSALFAVLAARLSADDSVLLLTNAAGATTRGSQVDAMLQRFIGELADTLGIANPLPEKATADDVEALFASLLGRVAETRRVVMLLDGLNEFDATMRAERMTWLRAQQWPANARLIATSLACDASETLLQWAGIEQQNVPSLSIVIDEQTDDVTLIARAIYQRLHRQVNPAVVQVLREKRLPDDSFAAGNPLWLTLALEQINLLDADDFARADHEFAGRGDAAERQQAMLLDTAERMPPTVVGLYDWLLAQSEKVFGMSASRAFAALIAVSRFGWRESDLLKLIPAAAGVLCPSQPEPKLDDLQLASLRRSFRAHLVRRGNLKRLDFFHRQMRQAVRERTLTDKSTEPALHRVIADHLESLELDDQLRNGELMVHLIAGDDPLRAAKTYATIPQSWQQSMSGVSSQTWSGLTTTPDTITLANFISTGSAAQSKRNREWGDKPVESTWPHR